MGRAVAQRFAREGAWIGLLARDPARLEDAKREIESLGGKAVIHAGDVADPAAHEAIADLVEQTFGAIDIWINNAMTSVYSMIHEMPPEEFRRVTDVTYLGVVYGTQSALRRMRARDRGMIVQVGSTLAYRSIAFQSAYCAAKHAVRGFTNSLRSELKHDRLKIGLTMVQLPAVNTPQFLWARNRLSQAAKPPAPIYQPEVAAEAIWWAAHHRRREVYVGYKTSLGIKLNKLIPAFLDRFLGKRSFGEAQRTRDPRQPDNLWRPAKGLYAARGPYVAEAQSGSLHLTISKHRSAWLWAFVGMASAVAFAWRRKNPSRGPVWNRR
ncbi:short-chain dehydrogenase/reductase SDR [Opitutus terrae PB90-1]|uniref:Short-chain dehydrogenase/reductase SDR n=1 Tax=Opitutus terrae (strain DSM 11246 / JCM 15787 / PB90-1) TaxID=452637 RepID=B1ZXI3_OPITP|nr:short-chain dehydrogenase/reductase SDR [Opitutus terrae PB90-1]